MVGELGKVQRIEVIEDDGTLRRGIEPFDALFHAKNLLRIRRVEADAVVGPKLVVLQEMGLAHAEDVVADRLVAVGVGEVRMVEDGLERPVAEPDPPCKDRVGEVQGKIAGRLTAQIRRDILLVENRVAGVVVAHIARVVEHQHASVDGRSRLVQLMQADGGAEADAVFLQSGADLAQEVEIQRLGRARPVAVDLHLADLAEHVVAAAHGHDAACDFLGVVGRLSLHGLQSLNGDEDRRRDEHPAAGALREAGGADGHNLRGGGRVPAVEVHIEEAQVETADAVALHEGRLPSGGREGGFPVVDARGGEGFGGGRRLRVAARDGEHQKQDG